MNTIFKKITTLDTPYGTDTEIVAIFPTEVYDREQKFLTGYAHIGQHTAICPSFLQNQATETLIVEDASVEEYTPLLEELKQIGYEVTVMEN